MLPSATVDDSIATLAKFPVIAQLRERNLIVLNEVSCLIRHVIIAFCLLLHQRLLQFAFQVLGIGSSLFQFIKDFPLVR